jgi:hypothetical protein
MGNISAISVPRTKHNVYKNVVFGWVCVRKLRFASGFKWGSCYSIFSHYIKDKQQYLLKSNYLLEVVDSLFKATFTDPVHDVLSFFCK